MLFQMVYIIRAMCEGISQKPLYPNTKHAAPPPHSVLYSSTKNKIPQFLSLPVLLRALGVDRLVWSGLFLCPRGGTLLLLRRCLSLRRGRLDCAG